MMIRIIIAGVLLMTGVSTQAQVLADAVRYSEITPLGTARTVGVGSSFGAMGGDFSVIGINPAGLGTYFKSEFTITPAYGVNNTDATLAFASSSRQLSETYNGLGLDNIAIVSSSTDFNRNWIASNWGIGFSKSKSLGRTFRYRGSKEGSITERWAQLADGASIEELDNFETFPAYDAGVLIDNGDNTYSTDFFDDDVIDRSELVEESGYISELQIAYAANYKNKLNIGFSVGIPFLSFEQQKTYTEVLNALTADGDPILDTNLEYRQYLNTTGAGLNLKAGVTYNFNPIRIGAALHSPTWFSLDEDFDTAVAYSYVYFDGTGSGTGSSESVDGNFSYSFSNPWRAVGSIGSLLSFGDVKGFVNADIEYVDYRSAAFNLRTDTDNFGDAQYERQLNSEIDNQLQSAVNLRLGAELTYEKVRFRAGYNYIPSAYAAGSAINAIALGTGYRGDSFFFDLAYRVSMFDSSYIPYASAVPTRDPRVEASSSVGRLVATFGFKF